MRISQLSQATGVSQATIKYYLRKGLLPRGEAVTATLAEYGEEHIRRLRLIRALIDVGGLSVAATAEVLRSLDEPDISLHDMLGATHYALSQPARVDGAAGGELAPAFDDVEALITARGWKINPRAPSRLRLAQALHALKRVGLSADVEALAPYADVAERIAEHEVGRLPTGSRAEAARVVALGTVLYEPVLASLRTLAQEAISARRFARKD